MATSSSRSTHPRAVAARAAREAQRVQRRAEWRTLTARRAQRVGEVLRTLAADLAHRAPQREHPSPDRWRFTATSDAGERIHVCEVQCATPRTMSDACPVAIVCSAAGAELLRGGRTWRRWNAPE